MNLHVWPRLPDHAAHDVLGRIEDIGAEELRARSGLDHPDAAPVEVGGQSVDPEQIESLASKIRAHTDALGFPAALNRSEVTRFDSRVTRILHDSMAIIPADAAAMQVWSYLSLVVMPDVAVWRWPARHPNRLLGRPRNVFGRLWQRAEVVGADLIDTERGLGEDELVNIMERPTIAADRRLARTLAKVVVELRDSGVARSEVMRDAARRVLRLQAVICPEVLDAPALDDLIRSVVSDAVDALRTQRAEGRPASAGWRSPFADDG